MKLSDALLHAIESGAYSRQLPFMCIALKRCNLGMFVTRVEDTLDSMGSSRYGTLAIALSDIGLFDSEDWLPEDKLFQLTKEFYVWWIIQLRSKGL